VPVSTCTDKSQTASLVTSGQSNLTKLHRHTRQTVQSYSPGCAHDGTLAKANTIELVLPPAYPSPQPKQQVDRLSCFCTAHGRKSLYFTTGALPPKLLLSIGGSGPHLTYDSLGSSKPTTQTASLLIQPSLHRWLQSVPMLYNGTPILPQKFVPSHGGIWALI